MSNHLIEENAVVVGLDAQSALLEIERKTACGLCGKTRGCGVSLLGKLFNHKHQVFKADNHAQAKIGQSVIVGIPPNALLKSAALIYGVPLMGVLLGAIMANVLVSNLDEKDIYTMIGALLGLMLSLLWLKLHSAGGGINTRYKPIILRVSDQKVINISCERGM